MKTFRYAALAIAVFGLMASGFGQLGKGKGSGGGSGGGSSSPPPKSNPPSSPPPKNDPPPKSNPPSKGNPPNSSPPSQGNPPSKGNPPRSEQPPASTPPIRNPQSGTGANGEPIGRIERDSKGNSNTGLTEKSVREGRNINSKSYNGSVNNLTKNTGRNSQPVQIQGIPQIPSGSLSSQVLREENVRRRNDFRVGYHHYNNQWCDDWFWNSNYVFSPYRNHCVISPWYYYPSLPGYINSNSITIINIGGGGGWNGNSYNYYRPGNWNWGYGNQRGELDYAVDDLVQAFEEQDRRALGRLVSKRGTVDIYLDGRYDYSIDSDHFYDLMLDGIYNTRTRRYDIVNVRTYRNEAEVTARHDYIDPWGRYSTLYHWYRLEEDRRGFVITKFGTQSRRSW